MEDNIIQLNDVAKKKTITLKQAAEILGMSYHTARNRVRDEENKIGYFDYDGTISVVEEDVLRYKRNHFVSPKGVR